ncbi:NAD(P)H-hydrate dehydratase, partial [Cognatilysobacter lacus]
AARGRYADSGGFIAPAGQAFADADLIVDALFGIGFVGEPRDDAACLIDAMNSHGAPVLSLDMPSGVDARGVGDRAVQADATIEFLLPKAVLRTGAALQCAGRITCAALGLPALVEVPAPFALLADAGAIPRWLPRRARNSHKGTNGRVACIGGDHGSGGAVLLCAEAALRAGAGLVRVHTRDANLPALLARIPEAMPAPEANEIDVDWPDVIAIGPGLGQGNWGFSHLHRLVEERKPCVFDADALNLIARHGFALSPDAILTPHPGEAARLLGCSAAEVQRDRLGAASRLAQHFGAVVVLKGAGTVVAAPARTPLIVDAGNPGMATGGMGDALTGVIAALKAQGLQSFDAACCGALLHSAAADLAAADGQRGLLPTDLMPHLRRLANP